MSLKHTYRLVTLILLFIVSSCYDSYKDSNEFVDGGENSSAWITNDSSTGQGDSDADNDVSYDSSYIDMEGKDVKFVDGDIGRDASDLGQLFPGFCVSKQDANNDGVVDRVTTYQYDRYGNLVREEDNDATDGSSKSITTYSYDDNGNRVSEEEDSNGDGVIEGRTTQAYNQDGEIETITRTLSEFEGESEVAYMFIFTYDENGRKIETKYDYLGDGIIEEITSYKYEDDKIVTEERLDVESDTIVFRIEYAYDDRGNVIREDTDIDGDGFVDISTGYTYNSNGNMIGKLTDYLSSMRDNKLTTYIYDDRGNILVENYDNDDDGIVDGKTTYEYDCWE